jgi:hypothetical protein
VEQVLDDCAGIYVYIVCIGPWLSERATKEWALFSELEKNSEAKETRRLGYS